MRTRLAVACVLFTQPAALLLGQSSPIGPATLKIDHVNVSRGVNAGATTATLTANGFTATMANGNSTVTLVVNLPVATFPIASLNTNSGLTGLLTVTPAASFTATLSNSDPTDFGPYAYLSPDPNLSYGLCFYGLRSPGAPCTTASFEVVKNPDGSQYAVMEAQIVTASATAVFTANYTFVAATTDSLTLTNWSPDPAGGFSKGLITFSGHVKYSFSSFTAAWVALRLYDAPSGGNLLGSSNLIAATRPSGENDLDFTVQIGDDTPDTVYLRAVLINRVTETVAVNSDVVVAYNRAPDVSIDHVEFVQVNQDVAQKAIIQSGKPTVMRIFVKQVGSTDDPFQHVNAKLSKICLSKDGATVLSGVPQLLNSVNGIMAREAPDRTLESQSLNFLLPNRWTLPEPEGWTCHIHVELQLPDARAEGPKDNNEGDFYMLLADPVFKTDDLFIQVYQVCVNGECPDSSVGINLDLGALAMEQLYPVDFGAIHLSNRGTIAWPPPAGDEIYSKIDSFQVDLYNQNARSFLNAYLDSLIKGPVFVLGVIPNYPPIGDRTVGYGQALGISQNFYDANEQPNLPYRTFIMQETPKVTTMAHEISHLLGLQHTKTDDSCGQDPGQTDWPFQTSAIQDPGYSLSLPGTPGNQFEPITVKDLMSGCDDRWFSAVNYEKIQTSLSILDDYFNPAPLPGLQAQSLSRRPGKGRPRVRMAQSNDPSITFMRFSGFAGSDGSSGILLNAYPAGANEALDASKDSGAYCVRLFAGSSQAGQNCFDVSFLDVNDEPLLFGYFSRVLAVPAGITSINLALNGTSLTSLSSGGTPTVQITSLQAGAQLQGPQTIQWTGSDPNSAVLTYRLDYSTDGGQTWGALLGSNTNSSFSFDAGSIPGSANAMFRVTASNGLQSAASVVGPVAIVQNPALSLGSTSVDFGNLQLGQSSVVTVPIQNSGDGFLNLTSIQSDNPEFSAVVSMNGISAGSSASLRIRFTPDATGLRTATLTFSTTDPANPTYQIPLSGTGFDTSIQVSATSLNFGNVTIGQPVQTMTFNLGTAGGAGTVLVSSISLTGAAQGFSLVSPPATPFAILSNPTTITVGFQPKAAGPQTGSISILSSDSVNPAITISLTGTGAINTAPAMSVTPASLDFGSINTGTTKDLTVQVGNTGNAPLTAQSVTSSNSNFTVTTGAPFTVAPGGSQTVTVRFAPTASGAMSGNLTFTSNDPNNAAVTVNLTGTGLAAPSGGGTGNIISLKLESGTYSKSANTLTNISATWDTDNSTKNNLIGVTLPTASSPLLNSPGKAVSVPAGNYYLYANPGNNGTDFRLTVTWADGTTDVSYFQFNGYGSSTAGAVWPNEGGTTNATLSYIARTLSNTCKVGGTVPETSCGIADDVYSVTIQGAGGALGGLIASPSSLDFGSVTVGQSGQSKTVTLTNTAAASVTVSLSAGAPFSVAPASLTIPGNGSSAASVTFSPVAAATASGTLSITASGSASPAATVSLTGTGLLSQTGGGTGNIVSFQLETGTYNKSNNTLTNITATWDTDNATKNWMIGVSQPSASSPLLNTPGKAINIPAGSYYLYANPSYNSNDFRLTTSWSDGTIDVAYFQFNGYGSSTAGAVWPNEGGATNATFTDIERTLPTQCKVGGSSAETSCGAADDVYAITIKGSGGTTTAPPPPTASCLASPSSLVSWWPGDSSTADLKGGNNGTANSGVTYGAGEVGQSLQFDGTSAYLEFGNPANLKITSGITVDAWVNPRSIRTQTAGPAMGAIVTKWAQSFADTSGSDSYGLWLIQSGSSGALFSAIHQAGGKEPAVQGGTVPLNTWTHVAMTFDAASGQYVLYVNGQQVAFFSAPGAIYTTDHNVNMGREESYINRFFDGRIDEAQVFSRALTAAEIQSIYKAGAAGVCK